MRTRKDKFHKTLLSALDESMETVFGKSAARAVYYYLEKSHLLKLEDIPEKPQVFSKAIEEMFGKTGAEVIETLLLRDLLTKLGVKGRMKEADKLVNWLDKLKATYGEK